VGEVVGPDPVGLPLQPVRPRCPRSRFPGRLTRKEKPFLG
jgi:hypothetical protein